MYDPRPDEQVLLQSARELDDAFEAGAPHRKQVELLEGVMDAARSHFLLEEHLMQRVRYPGLREHQQAHDLIRRRIVELLQSARGLGKPIANVLPSLAALISAHVIGPDTDLYEFLARMANLSG